MDWPLLVFLISDFYSLCFLITDFLFFGFLTFGYIILVFKNFRSGLPFHLLSWNPRKWFSQNFCKEQQKKTPRYDIEMKFLKVHVLTEKMQKYWKNTFLKTETSKVVLCWSDCTFCVFFFLRVAVVSYRNSPSNPWKWFSKKLHWNEIFEVSRSLWPNAKLLKEYI